jgi:hypothetical protein
VVVEFVAVLGRPVQYAPDDYCAVVCYPA